METLTQVGVYSGTAAPLLVILKKGRRMWMESLHPNTHKITIFSHLCVEKVGILADQVCLYHSLDSGYDNAVYTLLFWGILHTPAMYDT